MPKSTALYFFQDRDSALAQVRGALVAIEALERTLSANRVFTKPSSLLASNILNMSRRSHEWRRLLKNGCDDDPDQMELS